MLTFYVVVGGHDSDPDPVEGSRIRVRNLALHGPNVKDEHLPFVQMLSADNSGSSSFQRPPPPGTIVVGFTPKGAEQTGYVFPLGVLNGIYSDKTGVPGNTILPFLKKARGKKLDIRLPPDVQNKTEENRSGIEKLTREIKEKGEKFALQIYDELQSHGAMPDYAGIRNVPLQNITTALDKGISVLTSQILSQLPTEVFNLGSILGQIQGMLPSNLQTAVNNLMKILPNDLAGSLPAMGSSLGNQVNPIKLLELIQDDIENIKNIHDLLNLIRKLSNSSTWSSSLSDLDNISFNIDSIFGEIKMILKPDGSLEQVINDVLEQVKQVFSSSIQSIPGATQTKTMFTDDGEKITELIERLVDQDKVQELQRAVEKQKSETNEAKKRARETGPKTALGACTTNMKNGVFTDYFGNVIEYNGSRIGQ